MVEPQLFHQTIPTSIDLLLKAKSLQFYLQLIVTVRGHQIMPKLVQETQFSLMKILEIQQYLG